jgi:hypothetical protein
MSVILGAQGDWDDIPPLVGIFALVGLGMFVAAVGTDVEISIGIGVVHRTEGTGWRCGHRSVVIGWS